MKLRKLLRRALRPAEGCGDAVDQRLAQIAERLDVIEAALEEMGRTHQLLPAVARKLFLAGVALPPPFDLSAERFGIYSQNGEDGVILAIFRQIGVTDRRFVEIGCGVNGGNSGFLARECGWTGLMVDGRGPNIDKIAVKFAGYGVTALRRLVTRELVNGMLQKFGYTGDVDFFSIDVDGVDFWLWDALEVCRPRLMAIEYNYLLGPNVAVTVPYDPAFDLTKMPTRAYRGASLEALVRLGRRKGYRLVATERVNAFFVRDDVGPSLPACPTSRAYRAPENRVKDVFEKITRAGLSLLQVGEDGTAGDPMPLDPSVR